MDWHEIWYYIFLCSNRMTLSLLLVPPVRQSGHEVSESWASTKWISTKTHIYGSQVMIPEFSDPLIFQRHKVRHELTTMTVMILLIP